MSNNLTEKLSIIQSDLKAPKGQFNAFGKYAYRSCEDILEAVKPHLKKNGIILTVSDSINVVNVGDSARVYVTATAKVSDGVDTIEVTASAREAENKKGMDESQITGSTSSYARKYALNGLFLIDDTKDADATNNHGKTSTSKESVIKKKTKSASKETKEKNDFRLSVKKDKKPVEVLEDEL